MTYSTAANDEIAGLASPRSVQATCQFLTSSFRLFSMFCGDFARFEIIATWTIGMREKRKVVVFVFLKFLSSFGYFFPSFSFFFSGVSLQPPELPDTPILVPTSAPHERAVRRPRIRRARGYESNFFSPRILKVLLPVPPRLPSIEKLRFR